MAKVTAAERARRHIALLGRFTNGARIPIAELAEQVGTTEAELTVELETLAMCGVPPFGPDDCIPLIVDEGYVEVWSEMPAMRGPVRLSAPEARAIAAALQAAGFSGDDPLTTRLLEASSASFDAAELEHVVRSAIATHEASVYEALATGAAEHRIVRLRYVTAGAEEALPRDVEPTALFAERGAWYLLAWCRRAGGWRNFRVDRIQSATLSERAFPPRGASTGELTAMALDDLPTARLRFQPGESFTERDWPGVRSVTEEADGSVIAEVPYGGTEWIARHVVAHLGAVEVLEPSEVREAVSAMARSVAGG